MKSASAADNDDDTNRKNGHEREGGKEVVESGSGRGSSRDESSATTAAAAAAPTPTTAWRRKKTPSSSNHSVEFTLPPKDDACQDDNKHEDEGQHDNDDNHGTSSGSPNSSRKKKLTYARSSSALVSPTHYDTHLLKRAVADAGRWAYGIILVEVWALNHDHTYLYRPDDGYWIDPAFHNSTKCQHVNCNICKLLDPSKPGYVPPNHQSPGQGLPGVLWSEVARSWSRSFRETLADKILGKHVQHAKKEPPFPVPIPPSPVSSSSGNGRERMSSSHNSFLEPYGIHINTSHFSSHIVWRSIPQLESDPDQPWNPRLQLLASIGMGWAAAVPFNLHGDQGIVVYVARNHVDLSRLQSESNEAYLVSASDLIAAAYALRGPRQHVVKDRHTELSRTLRIVRHKIVELHRQGINLKTFIDTNVVGGGPSRGGGRRPSVEYATPVDAVTQELQHRRQGKLGEAIHQAPQIVKAFVHTSIRKAKGAGAPIPPVYSWKQSFLTFFGSFTTLLAITSLSDLFSTTWGPDYGIVLGPFGASMTLLFGLTAAPASQPRNVMIGQIVSMTVAVSVSYASPFPVWLRQSLGAALAITCMVKLGVTHPPAGATALILSTTVSDSTRHSWFNMLVSLIGNVIAVLMATFINNLSDKRQYPMYWGLSWSDLFDPIKEAAFGLQERLVLLLAAFCRFCCCGCGIFQGPEPHHGRHGHHHYHHHHHRRGGSPASRLRASRRVGLEEDLEEGSA